MGEQMGSKSGSHSNPETVAEDGVTMHNKLLIKVVVMVVLEPMQWSSKISIKSTVGKARTW